MNEVISSWKKFSDDFFFGHRCSILHRLTYFLAMRMRCFSQEIFSNKVFCSATFVFTENCKIGYILVENLFMQPILGNFCLNALIILILKRYWLSIYIFKCTDLLMTQVHYLIYNCICKQLENVWVLSYWSLSIFWCVGFDDATQIAEKAP